MLGTVREGTPGRGQLENEVGRPHVFKKDVLISMSHLNPFLFSKSIEYHVIYFVQHTGAG